MHDFSQANLSVHRGRVFLPEALAHGYLAPVLSWLAESETNERDRGDDGAGRQIFTNAAESVLMFGMFGTRFF